MKKYFLMLFILITSTVTIGQISRIDVYKVQLLDGNNHVLSTTTKPIIIEISSAGIQLSSGAYFRLLTFTRTEQRAWIGEAIGIDGKVIVSIRGNLQNKRLKVMIAYSNAKFIYDGFEE